MKNTVRRVVSTNSAFLSVLLGLALVAQAGCQGGLSRSAAGKILRAGQTGLEPVFITVNALQDDRIAVLTKAGLVTFTPAKEIGGLGTLALTPEGKAAGLELLAETENTIQSVQGKICNVVYGGLTSIAPRAGKTPELVDVAYTLKYANHTALYERVKGTSVVEDPVDRTISVAKKGIFVRGAKGWSLNHAPQFVGGVKTRTETKFDYDADGLLIGAVTELVVETPPVDSDGDPIAYRWSGEVFAVSDGSRKEAPKLEADGLKARWKREILMGEPARGTITLTATDPYGEEAVVTFRFE